MIEPDSGDSLNQIDMIFSADGGVIILGDIRNHPDGRMWLHHTNAQGTSLWTKVYPLEGVMDWGQSSRIILCSDGGFGIVGTTSPMDNIGTPHLIRLDEDGDLLWHITFPLWGNNCSYSGRSLVQCTDNGFAVIGRYNQRYGFNESFHLLRTDANGNRIWNYTYPLGNSFRSDIFQCEDGGFMITGKDRDGVVIFRTDSQGSLLWNHSYDFSNQFSYLSYARSISCHDGGVAITGYASTYSFQGRKAEMFLLRFDSEGMPLWNHSYGGPEQDYGLDVVECLTGGFALVGDTQSFGRNDHDLCVVRTDDDGKQVWTNTYDYLVGTSSRGFRILEADEGRFVIMAYSSDNIGQPSVWLLSVPDLDFYEPTLIDPADIPWDQLLPFILLGVGLGIPILILSGMIVWLWHDLRKK
jgi:hypothetical protein